MAVAYPLSLRTIVKANKRRSGPAAFREIAPRRGMGYSQTIGTEPPLIWDAVFRFTRAEAETFRLWFEYTLLKGLEEAIVPIATEFGLIDYTVQFLPDSLMTASQNGEVWEFSASLLARSMVIPGTAPSSAGLTTDWPTGLPTFLRQSKRRRQEAAFKVSDWRMGYAHAEASGTDNPTIWDVEMRYTADQAALFMVWFRDVLDMGVLPFTVPIATEFGVVSHTVKFLPGSLLDCTEAGATFTYRAQIATSRFYVPSQYLETDILLWLRAEETIGTTLPTDSSPYARVASSAAGSVTAAQTKCGSSVFGTTGGFDVKYSAAEFPPFEASPFRIQFHWFWSGGDATAVLVARMVQGESSSFGLGWRLIASVGTGFIFQSLAGSGSPNSRTWNAPTGTGFWRHLALQYTGSDLELYLDTVKLTPTSTTGTPVPRLEAGAEFHIGHGRDAGATVNGGYIDEFQVVVGSQLGLGVSSACPV